uniref:Uncharacterized protein n=1 Tax=Oncorhynchus kisutch TaxID=8019 RepID=A0A8C7KJB0_ONCKI
SHYFHSQMDTRLLVDSCWGHFTGLCILYGTVEYNTFSLVRESPSHPSLRYFLPFCTPRERLWMNVTLGGCMAALFFRLLPYHLCAQCPLVSHTVYEIPYDGNQFYTGVYNAEKSVWVNFFFWVLIVAVVFVQKRHGQNGARLKQNPSTDLSDPSDLTYSPMGAIMCLWI